MKWLIVEDALKNRQGHWVEYIDTFRSGLTRLGYDVTVLTDRSAEAFIAERVDTHPVLPESIWHRMGDNASRITRYLRVPRHALQTRSAIRKWLHKHDCPDVIFVPTVMVHHLLGWLQIYKKLLRHKSTKLVLFFPNTPLQFNEQTQQPEFGSDPTSCLFRWLIQKFAPAVRSGQVVLGVETSAMREAMTELTGVVFTYLPHPVACGSTVKQGGPTAEVGSDPARGKAGDRTGKRPLIFGSYGAARYEKGSDLLQAAITKHLATYPETDSNFVIQWLAPFEGATGQTIAPDPRLSEDDRVTFLDSYFDEGGYERQLAATDVMLLPYREPYRYRVSRVVIEAMVHAMPVVATKETTLWEQAEHFGAGLPCNLGDANSLATAIRQIEERRGEFLTSAAENAPRTVQHFSVKHFCELTSAIASC